MNHWTTELIFIEYSQCVRRCAYYYELPYLNIKIEKCLRNWERSLQELSTMNISPYSSVPFLFSYSDTNFMKKLSLLTVSLPTLLWTHYSMNSTFYHHEINTKFYAKCNTSKPHRQSYTDNFSVLFKKYSLVLKQIL